MSREIKILRKVRHQNCIQLYEIHESNKYLYFVMELPNGGELYDRIVENQRYLNLMKGYQNQKQLTISTN